MKTLKFREPLSRLILLGVKDTTWRLFDDKNLRAGERVSFVVWETAEPFSTAEILTVRETTFAGLTDADWVGHEKFASDGEMYATYSGYYNRPVTPESPVKVLKFRLQNP